MASGQTEFMLYGNLKVYKSKPDSTTITVESNRKQYGRVVKVDSTGEFRVWLEYAKEYVVRFEKPGYQTVIFNVSTKLPEGIVNCCFTPFDMSFHLFKPDGKYDSLFRKPIVKIKYEPRLRTFNYSLDIDYYIQKMYVRAETEKQQKIKDAILQARARDSLDVERKYMNLITTGNSYYKTQQFALSRQMYEAALQLKPERKYPYYKLEDIRTELELFNKTRDSLPFNSDSIVKTVVEKKPESKPAPVSPYRRKTPAEIEAMFRKDLHAQIVKETKDPRELEKRLAFVSFVLDKKKPEPVKNEKSDTIKPVVGREETVDVPMVSSPIVTLIKEDSIQFNEIAYQDSLKRKYPNERTIEIIQEDFKKTTRVIMNRENRVTIYLKVEHKWGATFYFIDNKPYPMENISNSFFEVSTKLPVDDNPSIPLKNDSTIFKR